MLEFGTDGVRGRANQELTPEFALSFGRALADVFQPTSVVIGRDTRVSGAMLQSALSSGLSSCGVNVVDVGVIPTPGIAYISAARQMVGVVISASHNPYQDNGIKVFGPGGIKLEDEFEQRLHSLILSGNFTTAGSDVGEILTDFSAIDEYTSFLLSNCQMSGSRRLKVVLDCSNGAAVAIAPGLFSSLDVDLQLIGAAPNGKNINDGCGSVNPEMLIHTVLQSGADLGIALDGDADRMLAVDGDGNLIDGDQILAMFALDLKSKGQLKDNSVVVTVMSNQGFRNAMSRNGIKVHETQVGDRYVLQALEQNRFVLGGEQSGHIIFRNIATTGDGLLSSMKLLELLNASDKDLSELARVSMTKLPQSMISMEFADPKRIEEIIGLWEMVSRLSDELGDSGRILVRPSGTEPKVRVMAEAPDRETADNIVQEICDYLVDFR